MNTTRIVCLLIENYPIVAALDSPEELSLRPLVVTEGEGKTSPVVAANDPALRDIRLGVTVAQAKTRCPDLHVLVRDRSRETVLSRHLLHLLQQVSPTVESNGEGCFYIDAPGLMRLHKNEQGIAEKIREVLSATKLAFGIGIAGNKLSARTAARIDSHRHAVIVPPGKEREFLAPLLISVLPLHHDTKEILFSLGLSTVNDIAALPSHEITKRFGNDVIALADFVRGKDPELYIPEALQTDYIAAHRLDFPLITQAQLYLYVEKLLTRLLSPLAAMGSGCSSTVLQLSESHDSPHTLTCSSKTPTAAVSVWMRQVRTLLEKQHSLGQITDIVITLSGITAVMPEQLSLSVCRNPSDHSSTTLSLPVKSIQYRPSVLPEYSFVIDAPEVLYDDISVTLPPYYTRLPVGGLRLLRPARQTRVSMTSEIIDTFGSERVVHQAGPWHVSGHWWDDEFRRRYYDIATSNGSWLLVYFDDMTRSWYLQGVFD